MNDESVQAATSSQNDGVYANVAVKRDVPVALLMKGRKHFSQRMMSVTVSNLGKTSLVFVQPGSYYCDVVLNQGLLPGTQKLSGNYFTFQQDGAPTHRSQQTNAFLHLHVPEIEEPENWPLNSPDVNPVDYLIWGALSSATVCLPPSSHSRH